MNEEEQSVLRSPSFLGLDSHNPSQLENGDKIFLLALVSTNFSLELNTGADHPKLRYEDVCTPSPGPPLSLNLSRIMEEDSSGISKHVPIFSTNTTPASPIYPLLP